MNRTPPLNAREPAYSIFRRSSRESLDTIEMHVLARAYRAAWRSIHARDPVSAHAIESLDLMIVFQSRD